MSKRARKSSDEKISKKVTDSIKNEETARKAGLRAYETVDGRKWLMKALNPNDIAVVTTGIPSLHSHNISVLNWQGEYSVDVPTDLAPASPSYDSTMFLYQHPLIFGMSAARQTGCQDLREVKELELQISYDRQDTKLHLVANVAPSKSVALTHCRQYFNNQINPAVFGGQSSLSSRRQMLSRLTQRTRMIYGGATIIPTCSDENNGGNICICQQVFNARKIPVGIKPEEDPYHMDATIEQYSENDFPDTSDTVQNPQMYYSRFQDGAYIPYKMMNPHQFEYVNSEDQIVTQAPYFIENVSFLAQNWDGANHQLVGTIVEYPAELIRQAAGTQFDITPKIGGLRGVWVLYSIRFYITTYTGQRGYFDIGGSTNTSNTFPTVGNSRWKNDTYAEASPATLALDATFTTAAPIFKSSMYNESMSGQTCNYTDAGVTYYEYPGSLSSSFGFACNNQNSVTVGDHWNGFIRLPQLILAYDRCGKADYFNPIGIKYYSKDTTPDAIDTELRKPSISPYNGNYIISIHMSGVSNTAPIKMILKYGCEILLVASSPYSPFKFMSPKYDESAIKTYARCIRSMRDAYFANAGSIPGQNDYLNRLNTLIETDSADELNSVLNQGGQWLGTVGV